MKSRPFSVSAALILILLNALIWLVFGVIFAINAHPALPDIPLVKGIMAGLSFIAAAVLFAVFWFLRKRSRLAYFIALGALAVAALLTLFDQFGWSDLIIFVIDIIPLFLLIKDRGWYLQS
jgi:lysylphosphatidylglycerol synthetase-like protein (DUF2156 family)